MRGHWLKIQTTSGPNTSALRMRIRSSGRTSIKKPKKNTKRAVDKVLPRKVMASAVADARAVKEPYEDQADHAFIGCRFLCGLFTSVRSSRKRRIRGQPDSGQGSHRDEGRVGESAYAHPLRRAQCPGRTRPLERGNGQPVRAGQCGLE